MLFDKIQNCQFIFFAGKGGTGKTTCSATFALHLARKGYKSLLVSTDMAHSLSHIFEVNIGGKETKIEDNLWAIEIDPQKEAKKYMKKIKDTMAETVSSVIIEEIKKQINAAYLSPGVEETAVFEKFVELMEKINSDYKKIVFDTAPTGHTLRLLTLPQLMEGWIERLIKKRLQVMKLMTLTSKIDESIKKKVQYDPIIEILNKRKEKLVLAKQCLLDKKRSGYLFVLDAERLSILETAEAISLLRKHGLLIAGIIVNRVLPQTSDQFFAKRKELQEKRLNEIKSIFKGMPMASIPLLDTDIQGKDILTKIKLAPLI